MAETLYGDRQDAGARVDPLAPRPLLPMQAGRAKPRPAGLLASVRAALDDRRGFVLLPFGMCHLIVRVDFRPRDDTEDENITAPGYVDKSEK